MIKTILITILVTLQVFAIAQDYKFYILSNDPSNNTPLYLCKLNSSIGTITIIEQYGGLSRGDYLALSPDNKHLLATCKNEANTESGIIQFNVAEDGLLTYIDKKLKTTSDQPCHVAFTPDMNYALSANYGDDEISLYNFSSKTISAEIDNIVKPDQSKGHFICSDPSGKFVHAVFLGLNKVFNYTIENDKFVANTNQEAFSVPNGYGPRHLVFHPNNNFMYLLNETHSSVTACSYNSETGVITEIQNISMLPADFTGNTHGAAIRIHPSGKFLYASNRGHNSIAVYKIAENGGLSLVEYETFGINFPRDFNISSDGNFMIIANQKGGSIMSVRIDKYSGELKNTGLSLTMTSPVSIEFIPSETEQDTTGTTAINNTIADKFAMVYPNPASNYLVIKTLNKQRISKIELYNLSGQLVKKITREQINSIDVADLKRGSYLLIASTKTNQLKQKIILK